MKTKLVLVAFVFFLYFTLIIKSVFAVTININQYPSSISSDPFNVNVFVSGASEGQNYLRVDLYKDGTSNYFGETNNGISWYGGSDGKQYLPITIDSSKMATMSVQARIGVPNSTEFSGAGNYKLKIRRYTSSGNPASSDQQNPADVHINFSLPTFTPIPSPTSKLSATSKANPTQTKTPTAAVKTEVPSSEQTALIDEDIEISTTAPTSILGISTQSATPTSDEEKEKNIKILGDTSSKIPIVLVTAGIFLGACGILSYFIYKKKHNHENV